MANDLRQRVADRLATLGRNPFEAARDAGLERSFVNDILIGKKRSIKGENLAKLAVALDWTISDLVETQVPTNKFNAEDGFAGRPLYNGQLEDSDYIQVSIGVLRNAAVRALRRGDVEEAKAEAVANVLVATLATHPDAFAVLRLAKKDRNFAELPAQDIVDPV